MHIQPYKMQDSQHQQWCFVSNIPTIQRVSTEPVTHKLQTNSDYPSPSMHLLPSKCISWLSWSSTWVCSREVFFRTSVGFKFYFPRKWLLCCRLHKQIHYNWHLTSRKTKPSQLSHRSSRLLNIFWVLMYLMHSFSRSLHASCCKLSEMTNDTFRGWWLSTPQMLRMAEPTSAQHSWHRHWQAPGCSLASPFHSRAKTKYKNKESTRLCWDFSPLTMA